MVGITNGSFNKLSMSINPELIDVIVSREVLESTGYESLEHVAECAERPLDRAFAKALRTSKGFQFVGTSPEHDMLQHGAHNLASAYCRDLLPPDFDYESIFRTFCFGRNFVAQMRRYHPALYEPDTPLQFDDVIDTETINHVCEYAEGRALLTRYADGVAIANSIPNRQPALFGVTRAAVLYTFMQAEQQAYDAFIGQQESILHDELDHLLGGSL